MKVVYITGCLGFIGTYVTEACLARGWKVYGVDKITYASNKHMLNVFEKDENFKFIKKDICNLKRLNDCDYIINTAAESHVGNSIVDSTEFIRSNVQGTKNLLDLIRHKQSNCVDPPVFFQFSTDEVYGDINEGFHVETDYLKPSNPYSATKAAADMLVLAWARTYGINYILFRPTNNYGKRQYHEKLIPISVRNLSWNKKIKLHNAGSPVRNWLHAYDTAEAVLAVIDSGKCNEIYNVAGGYEEKNAEVVRKIIHAYHGTDRNWKDYVDLDYIRVGQDVRYALDDSKLKSLGWTPKKIFDEEVVKVVDALRDNFSW